MARHISARSRAMVVCVGLSALLAGGQGAQGARLVPVPVLPLHQDGSEGSPVMAFRPSRKYEECVANAAGEGTKLEHCLDDELAYEQEVVARLLDDLASKLDGDAFDILHAQQQVWHRETERKCSGAEGDGTTRAHGTACRADRVIRRFYELSHQRSGIDASYWSEVQPDEAGELVMVLDDAEVTMQSQDCTIDITRVICSDVRLTVTAPGRSPQTLALPQVMLPRSTDPLRPAETGVRGPLDKGFVEGVYGVMLTDVNVDGHEDLMVWSGRDGTYGDPSYTYFIYDPAAGQLVENTAIAEAMMAHSLSRIVDGQLFAWYRSGPCERGEKTIDVRGAAPRIVARRDYNTCEGDRPW